MQEGCSWVVKGRGRRFGAEIENLPRHYPDPRAAGGPGTTEDALSAAHGCGIAQTSILQDLHLGIFPAPRRHQVSPSPPVGIGRAWVSEHS